MYVIIEDGGRQFKVEEGQEIELDYREISGGQELKFDRVLAYRDEDDFRIGQPTLDSVLVTGQVLGVTQGPKLSIQKFRRRKTYRRKTGHRQLYTRVKISKIEAAGEAAKRETIGEGAGSDARSEGTTSETTGEGAGRPTNLEAAKPETSHEGTQSEATGEGTGSETAGEGGEAS